MKAIWKYKFDLLTEFTLNLPQGAEILTLQTQLDKPCFWAMVEVGNPIEARTFKILGTGHTFPTPQVEIMDYIGTWQSEGFVWHVFEQRRIQ